MFKTKNNLFFFSTGDGYVQWMLAGCLQVGMELWSRWVHKTLWHAPMWQIHKSHHRPREGAFELNDVFAVMNSFPAIVLISIGYFNSGLLPALCFGSVSWDFNHLQFLLILLTCFVYVRGLGSHSSGLLTFSFMMEWYIGDSPSDRSPEFRICGL